MKKIQDDILSYREMCDIENVQTLQRGMNFRMNPSYSVILMSQRSNAPYSDKIYADGITIEYEGHDALRSNSLNPKLVDQPQRTLSGNLTQNGYFIEAIVKYKNGGTSPELVKVYEKILPGVWSLKGYFDLLDYTIAHDGLRNVFRYILKLSDRDGSLSVLERRHEHTRLIPSEVKKEVWKRDNEKCVLCGETKNLHFDHDLPFSKGGTSLIAKNIRLLCVRCNLAKSDKIE